MLRRQVLQFMVAMVQVVRGLLLQFLVRLILVCYFLFMVKPVMPVIIDHLAHAFWANVHFATVHKLNGKTHVHYELRTMVNNNEKDKSTQKYKCSVEDDVHIAVTTGEHCYAYLSLIPGIIQPYYLCSYSRPDQSIESPPPKPVDLLPVTFLPIV